MLLTTLLCFRCFVVQQLGWKVFTSSKVSRLEEGHQKRGMVEHETTRSAKSDLVWSCLHLNLHIPLLLI